VIKNKLNKKYCFNCKYRQRQRCHPELICLKHDKEIHKDDICNDWEYRYQETQTEKESKND
jgi:hypothetical protein